MFKDGDIEDKKYQMRLFDTFLVAVYVYDDEIKIVFSFSGDKNTVTIPIDCPPEAAENNEAVCSFKLCSAPPKQSQTNHPATIYMVGGLFVLALPFESIKT